MLAHLGTEGLVQPTYRVKQMRPNSIFGTVPPTICLIEIDGQKFRTDAHSNQEPSDKHDNTRQVHARSYPDTTNRVNYDRTCLDLQLNGKAVLSDDIASNTLSITKGSFYEHMNIHKVCIYPVGGMMYRTIG